MWASATGWYEGRILREYESLLVDGCAAAIAMDRTDRIAR